MTERSPRIVIIGAGIGGIAAAHTFAEAGFTDFVILEKGSDVGGVWYWNRYPGLTCDVPSQLYQFGFAPKPDWNRVWATGAEIQRYHRDLVDSLGLDTHLRLDSEVLSTHWDEDTKTWTVTTVNGARYEADFVVCATGVLHHPFIPEIPGLADFTGPIVHTARWDDGLVTAGRRVAVIGTGSTGVQVVSALAPEAAQVTHFVRSAQWVLWAPMGIAQPRLVGALLRRAPRAHRRIFDVAIRGSGLFTDVVIRPSWRRRAVQRYARLSLWAQVRDKALRSKLTPDYQPLCKRQVVSGTYYRAIQRDNVGLVTDDIVEVTRTGIRTAGGVEHEFDAIVLATGFRAHDYMRPMEIVGRDGVTIEDAWAKGPRAYRMTAIPGFPNLFTVLGPNSPTGSIPLQHSAEQTARYIVGWLRQFRDGEVTAVEVTEEATSRFNDDVAEALGPTVWNTGCNSWYFSDAGTVDLWPFDRATLDAMLAEPDPADYHVDRA